jgi:hypothetical protein
MSDLFDDQPDAENWSFDKIRLSEPKRADALEKAPKFLDILDTIVGAAARAVRAGSDAYFWASEPHSSWRHFKRAVFQFPVEADQFEFFWNARTGFRAQFWLSPETGARAKACAREIVVARWNDVRALRPPDGDVGWLEIKGQYQCVTEGSHHQDTWALMTPSPDQRAELLYRNGFYREPRLPLG